MSFNDSMVYFVPPAETNWLFTKKNLQALNELCSDHKRPRITTCRVRKVDLPRCRSLLDMAKKSHRVSFPVK